MRATEKETVKGTKRTTGEIKEATEKVAQLKIEILAIMENLISLTYPVEVEELVAGEPREQFDSTIKVNRLAMRGLHETSKEMFKVERSVA